MDDFGIGLAEEQVKEEVEKPPASSTLVFDIETGPAWTPCDSPRHCQEYCERLGIIWTDELEDLGPFDPNSVAVGNLKDPEKIKAKIETKRRDHQIAIEELAKKRAAAERDFWASILDKAALSPVTGRVLAIGYFHSGQYAVDEIDGLGECELLKRFWQRYKTGYRVTGWNIAGFDVPFLLARSAYYGLPIPKGLFARGKWLSDQFVDLQQIFGKMYDPWKQSVGSYKAKNVARFFGVYKRAEDSIDGADFWRYYGTPSTRQVALDYLQHDVIEEALIANRLGVLA